MTDLKRDVFSDPKDRARIFIECMRTCYPTMRPKLGSEGLVWYANESDTIGKVSCGERDQILLDRYHGKHIERSLPWSKADVMDSRYVPTGEQGNFQSCVNELLEWEQYSRHPKAAFVSQPGFGKSSALLELVLTPAPGIIRIVCLHTRDKRDEFLTDIKAELSKRRQAGEALSRFGEFVTVFGNESIVERHITELDEADRGEVLHKFRAAYSKSVGGERSKVDFCKVIDQIRDEGMLTSKQAGRIKHDWAQQFETVRALHKRSGGICLVMTTAKMKSLSGRLVDVGDRVRIYQDEVDIGELTDFSNGVRDAFSGAIVPIKTPWSIPNLLALRICYLSCERAIVKELTRIYGGDGFFLIGEASFFKMFEPGLTVLFTDKSRTEDRPILVKELQRQGYFLIADGVEALANINHKRSMGSNELSVNESIAVIASVPDGLTIGKLENACGISASEAVGTWVGDKANQGIGRNLGFRRKSDAARCLVVIPTETNNKHRFWRHLNLGFIPSSVQVLVDNEVPRHSIDLPENQPPQVGEQIPKGIDLRALDTKWKQMGYTVEIETKWPRIDGKTQRQNFVKSVVSTESG